MYAVFLQMGKILHRWLEHGLRGEAWLDTRAWVRHLADQLVAKQHQDVSSVLQLLRQQGRQV